MAGELGISHEIVPTIQANRLADPAAPDAPLNMASPALRAINPNGLIPCIDDDGFVLSESLATNLYLAKKHGGPLAPASLHEDGLMTMWAIWAVTECEPHTIQILLHRASLPAYRHEPAQADAAVAGRFTVADINFAEVLRYAQPAAELFAGFPAVAAWLGACQARPAFVKMMAQRDAEAV